MASRRCRKSLGNYIGIDEPADEMFGKIMSISDDLMWRYFELLSFEAEETIAAWRREIDDGGNPRDTKFRLAQEIVGRFHGEGAARDAQQSFVDRFQRNKAPEDMPELSLEMRKRRQDRYCQSSDSRQIDHGATPRPSG